MFEAGGHIYDPGMRWENLDVSLDICSIFKAAQHQSTDDEMKQFPEWMCIILSLFEGELMQNHTQVKQDAF